MRLNGVIRLLPVIALAAWAQDDPTQKETLRLQALSDKERAALSQENARHAEWKRQQQARLQQMRQEIARLHREADSLKNLAAKTPTAKPVPVVKVAPGSPAEARRKAFAGELATLIESTIQPRLESELAPDVHRRALTELARGIRGGSVTPEEGVGQLFDQLSELVEEGGRVHAEPGSYQTAAGRAVRGTYLHAGGVLDAFTDRAGSFAAIRRRGESSWTEVSDLATREALARASRTLAGEEKGLLALPLGALR